MSTTNRKKNLKTNKKELITSEVANVDSILKRISSICNNENTNIKKWIKIPKKEIDEFKAELYNKQKALFLNFLHLAKENKNIKIIVKFSKK